MKNSKIIHVVPAYPPHLGGMELVSRQLVEKLSQSGLTIEVVTSNAGSMFGVSIENGVSVTRLKSSLFLSAPVSIGLFSTLWKSEVDIFAIHLAQAFFPDVAAFVARLRKIPYIVHVHGLVDPSTLFGNILLPIYRKLFLAPMLRRANHIIVFTSDYKDLIVKKYKISKELVSIIPHATDYSIVKEAKTFLHGPIRLLAVGRLSSQKNYPLLLRTMKALSEESALSYTLTVVGSGEKEEQLKQLSKQLHLEDTIIWKGRLDGLLLETEYEKADIFVHTAVAETFGIVFIEAMAKGLPICATKIIGVQNVVTEGYNGILCSLNAVEIAKSIDRIASNTLLYQKLSSNNLDTIKKYTWENCVVATTDIYTTILNKKYER